MRVRHAAVRLVSSAGRGIDAVLRKKLGVLVYSQDPACIFRISFGRAARTRVLAAGGIIHKGDPQVELHLWNERMEGRTVGLSLAPDMRRSFEELSAYLDRVDPVSRYQAVHGVVGIVGGRDVQRLAGILQHFGFETGDPQVAGHRVWRAGFWEAFYSRWLLFAFNSRASRRQRLGDLARFEMWLSRAALRERYGASSD